VFELESKSWRVELELESGIGDLRILYGNFLPSHKKLIYFYQDCLDCFALPK